MLDGDFINLYAGKLKPQDAFMNGKMKIKGNMAKAMKFNPSVLPKEAAPKLWENALVKNLKRQKPLRPKSSYPIFNAILK